MNKKQIKYMKQLFNQNDLPLRFGYLPPPLSRLSGSWHFFALGNGLKTNGSLKIKLLYTKINLPRLRPVTMF